MESYLAAPTVNRKMCRVRQEEYMQMTKKNTSLLKATLKKGGKGQAQNMEEASWLNVVQAQGSQIS